MLHRASPARWLAPWLVLLLAGCASLPSLEGRTESAAIASQAGAPIPDALAGGLAAHPGLSGFYSLADAEDAFAARIALVDAAVRTLDVQYYIWHADVTGRLLFDAVQRAAARGVRVRLLLDDNNTAGLDPLLAALEAQPNLEVRLFNPFLQRRLRPLGFLTDFSRLNRRMHNKSITADGAATIVGGRNVGDEYFGAGDGLGFVDLDVVAVGPVVREVAQSFDAYWRSESAYPVAALLPAATPAQRAALARLGADVRRLPAAQRYLARVRDTRVMRDLVAQELPFRWATARLVVDEPAKGLGRAPREQLLQQRLSALFDGPVERELALVSPYFVPGRDGTRTLAELARRGVKVKVLTNALESTDVAAVHSGYAKRRRTLLEAGVELWELRRHAGRIRLGPRGAGRGTRRGSRAPRAVPDAVAQPAGAADADPAPRPPDGGDGGASSRGSGRLGSSDASLHAKTFAVDGERLFVGSFNFDPRSALYNTELGLVIDAPDWARGLSEAFERRVPGSAYRVQLDPRGRLEWIERHADGTQSRYEDEPGAGFGRKLAVVLFGLLPIEGLL
jgi:putative cardiolipin synthase